MHLLFAGREAGTTPEPGPNVVQRGAQFFAARYRPRHEGALLHLRPAQLLLGTAADQVDAIFSPAATSFGQRPAGVEKAVRLAAASGATLVVVCSQRAYAAAFPAEWRAMLTRPNQLICVDLDRVDRRWVLGPRDLPSQNHRISKLHRHNDAGLKRNLALVLAKAMGWSTLLFLDDDILLEQDTPAEPGATLTAQTLAGAVRVLKERGGPRIVGWRSIDFDDNSVAGHARKFCGRSQGVFPGSGAMLVDTSRDLPFFPAMYNEDWLFMIAMAQAARKPRRTIAVAGTVRQRPYEPFRPGRARSEEVGEVVAEALMNRLERGRALASCSQSFWAVTLRLRRQMLERLAATVAQPMKGRRRAEREAVAKSLAAALEVSWSIQPEELTRFISAWKLDLTAWSAYLGQVRAAGERLGDKADILRRFAEGATPPTARSSVPEPLSACRPDQDLVEDPYEGKFSAQSSFQV